MNRRFVLAIYFGFWALAQAAIVYLGINYGLSWLDAVALACLIFTVGHGATSYVGLRRRLSAEGKQPPSFLLHVFFPRGTDATVTVWRPVRVLLGILILPCGALFAVVSISLLIDAVREASLSMLIAAPVAGVVGILAVYIGWRLLFMRGNERLFTPLKQGDIQ
jgi:hypothetical protein